MTAPGDFDTFPPVYPSIEVLNAKRAWLCSVVQLYFVRLRDAADIAAEVILAAYLASQEGLYRPDPQVNPWASLDKWLYTIAYRKGISWTRLAVNRREIPVEEPWALVSHGTVDPEPRITARAILRTFASLPADQREILAMAVDAEALTAYACLKGWLVPTTYTRRRYARREFAKALRKRLW